MLSKFKKWLFEEKQKTVVAFHGKVRIPTIGHKSVIDHAKTLAKKHGGNLHINLSGADKPLSTEHKKQFAEKLFNHPVHTNPKHSSIVHYLSHLHSQGYHHLHLVAGSDRAKEYHSILSKYNGKADKKGNVPFHFKSWKVHEHGAERTESSKHPTKMSHHELLQSVSASKLESLAKSGDKKAFHAYHPGVDSSHVEKLYKAIRSNKDDK